MTLPVAEPEVIPWHNFTDEQRKVVGEIEAWQKQNGLSDAEFLAGTRAVSTTSWSRIRSGIYTANPTKKIEELKRHAKKRREQLERAAGRDSKVYIEFPDYLELRDAVRESMVLAEMGEEERLVWYLAGTGCGKTASGKQLIAEFGGHLITARESWKTSYFSALKSAAEAIGIRPVGSGDKDPQWRNVPQVESALVQQLKERPCLLVLNEVEDFGRPFLNLLKTLLNETLCTITVMAVPTFYDAINNNHAPWAAQLRRRAVAVITAQKITAKQTELFLKRHWTITPDLSQAARYIAEAANRFGGFGCIQRIMRILRAECAQDAPQLDQVHEALAQWQALVSDPTTRRI